MSNLGSMVWNHVLISVSRKVNETKGNSQFMIKTSFQDSLQNRLAKNSHLVGGFNPFEKYARQIGSFPQGSE